MTIPDADKERLLAVARALGPLSARVVFVGGSITPLLIDDPGAPPTRQTYDVDVIVRVDGRPAYQALETELRVRGFRADIINGSPLCRWFHGDLVVDVMPDDAAILGFSNRWYRRALEHAVEVQIGDVSIRVVDPVTFLLTKIEAFLSRGHDDFQGSHDMEDIIAVVDGRQHVVEEVRSTSADVRAYLADQFEEWLDSQRFNESLEGHLLGDRERIRIVQERLEAITHPIAEPTS